MSSIESGIAAIITKYGWIKALTLGSALLGAFIMAVFRPPKSKKEMATQAMVALSASLLFGDTVVSYADYLFDFIDLSTVGIKDYLQFYVTIHGLVGAFSWGLFGGIAHYRDKLATSPTEVIKDVGNIS